MHPSGVAKSSTSFGWGKGGNVTSAGWQVTLCDPIWYASSRSGDDRPTCKLLYAHFHFHFQRRVTAGERTAGDGHDNWCGRNDDVSCVFTGHLITMRTEDMPISTES